MYESRTAAVRRPQRDPPLPENVNDIRQIRCAAAEPGQVSNDTCNYEEPGPAVSKAHTMMVSVLHWVGSVDWGVELWQMQSSKTSGKIVMATSPTPV
jgi:hypothetical protein